MAAVEGTFQQQQLRSCVPIKLPVLERPHVSKPIMDPAHTERPASALARGIKITEYKEIKVNPEPIPLEESELILEEYLSPSKLRDLAGVDNLDEVRYLEMKVDTRDTSLGNFGTHLPNLAQLKLSSSIITSVRDLGSSFNNLRVLWMARCGLEHLDGLSSMSSLEELYLAYNELCDISACSLLEHLQILDLEGNNIDEIMQVNFLNMCSKLRNLTLEGNPVCVTPSPDTVSDDYDYRRAVKEVIPHLELLDDQPVTDHDGQSRRSVSAFDDDWALIDELMREGAVIECDDGVGHGEIMPAGLPTSPLRPSTGYRPGSALKNYPGTGIRPSSRSGRPGTQSGRPGTQSNALFRPMSSRPASARPGSSRSGGRPDSSGQPHSGDDLDNIDDASDLTRGGVVCGNPSRALKARHKPHGLQSQSVAKIMQQLNYKPQHSEDISLENDDDLKDLMAEINEWKSIHSKRQKEIEAKKAPQVLTIDHSDDVLLADDEESIDSDSDEELSSPFMTFHSQASERTNGVESCEVQAEDESLKPIDARPKLRARVPSPMTRKRTLRYDESFESLDDLHSLPPPEEGAQSSTHEAAADKKSSGAQNVRSPSPPPHCPLSNSASPSPTHRLSSDMNRASAKVGDRPHPVIRALIHSPEGGQSGIARQDGALGQPGAASLPPARIRKGLHNVQLLPSKFNK